LHWSNEASQELGKIPGFVRGKIKRNTEKFARDKNFSEITLEIMYAAKETAGG
jgi:light-independent protochlorophyllide reductase subunit B